MLKIEYDILAYIKEHDSCRWVDVINQFDPQSSCRMTDGLLISMSDAQLIKTSGGELPLCIGRLNAQAWREMALYQQNQEEKEAHRRQRRNDLFVTAAISIVSTVVGAVLGNIHFLF